ncbi:hypothetical protein AWJ20_2400 [Sugiyamaella lignohabitans]|uniref:Uncharacterized protein n=1 Tax=Sugiyamaella lignohabitans TaxID=796027 RepID=A0A167F3T9_9ASCO|nr:uncharacterized protein AWJ20_2400 [Sugiyamaella lignohabitans]ANB14793.1 hypothetical protein AWJ20_2400 [Sugiyamaella lignohabitans]
MLVDRLDVDVDLLESSSSSSLSSSESSSPECIFKMASSMRFTSSSIDSISGAKPSVMSSISAYEIQSDETLR